MPEAHTYLPNTSAVHPSDLWVHVLFLVSLEPGPSAWLSFRLANAEGPPDFFDYFCIEDWYRPRMCICSALLVNVTSLIFFAVKRFREPKEERRPWRIWFYDTSKQAIGALFIHFANIFLSDLTEEDPCSLYLINFILDATLGMLLIWLGVKVVSWIVQHKKYTYLVFGEYGDPPQAAAWIGQCILYLLIMVFEKTVISLVLLIPGWTKLQQILLGYIPNPQLELVLVMLVVPFIVNAIMFWVVDSLIMRKYKLKDTLDVNGSTETPRARRTEESQMMWLEDAPHVALSASCKRSRPVAAS
ncbi:store-operated calcium entry regulator STIMATE-like isoform 2-T3 [Morphnus guianensis]